MIKAVIFDLDDTLYDEVEYCKSGFKAIAKYLSDNMDLNVSESELYSDFRSAFDSGRRRDIFNFVMDKQGLPEDSQLIRRLVNIYRNHIPDIKLPDDSKNLLDELKKDYRLALLTDGFAPSQIHKVRSLGIRPYFNRIVFSQSLGRKYWKPSVRGYKIILKKLNCPPESSVYIADNPRKDFIGPNKLKMHSVRLIRAASLHKDRKSEHKSAEPEYTTDKIEDIPDIIKKL